MPVPRQAVLHREAHAGRNIEPEGHPRAMCASTRGASPGRLGYKSAGGDLQLVPCVRITRASGSERLITPSGSSGRHCDGRVETRIRRCARIGGGYGSLTAYVPEAATGRPQARARVWQRRWVLCRDRLSHMAAV